VRVRRTAAVVAPLALIALTACEKPAPQVTVHAGGTVVNLDAVRYCHDECKDHEAKVKTLDVSSGDVVSFNVPTHVAEQGWYLRREGQQSAERPRKKLHYSLPIDAPLEGPVTIEIVQGRQGAEPEGIWKLTLTPEG
jgi:hypothetical protein